MRAASGIAFVCALALLAARFAGYETVLQLVAASLSADGVVTAAGRLQLARLLVSAALLAALLGVLLLVSRQSTVASNVGCGGAGRDPLRAYGLATPNAYLVLACSAGLGALLVTIWELPSPPRQHGGLPPCQGGTLRECDVRARTCSRLAVRCGRFAFQTARTAQCRAPSRCYMPYARWLCSLSRWRKSTGGRHCLPFETPSSWAAINFQQEDSVHNLLDRETLRWLPNPRRSVRCCRACHGGLERARPGSTIAAIAPQASLTPLALMTVYSGVYLHPEATELLLAVFVLFYSVRIHVAARSAAQSSMAAEADVPLTGVATPSSWNAELSTSRTTRSSFGR